MELTPGSPRWRQVDALFAEALDRPPEERDVFLRAACGDDAELLDTVRELLGLAEKAEQELGESVDRFAPTLFNDALEHTDLEPLPIGEQIGAYRVVREIGRGGMGAVYLAERADGEFDRRIAIKVIKRGMDTDEVLGRFHAERRILAGLEHPHIARLYDAGASNDGRPYLVMEYIDGERIDAWCDRHRLGVDERLRLFVRVCGAVQYAHRRLVVHRDLKPSNILVTADGEPKLLDFGIARFLDESETGGSPRTRTGFRLLTPEYASPEQLRGEQVTTASDVYQLGVLLYELLTGHRPIVTADRLPDRPSTVALRGTRRRDDDARTGDDCSPADLAAARDTTPERLRRHLAGDLDTIILKALDPEPERRYGSVQQLMDDVERFLAGLPVEARPAGNLYRVRKFVRRHRAGVAAAAAIVLSLVGGLGAALWQADAAAAARDRAERQRAIAEEASSFLANLFIGGDPYTFGAPSLDTLTVRHLLERGAERVLEELDGEPFLQGRLLATIGNVYANLAEYDRAVPLLDSALVVLVGDEPEMLYERAMALSLAAKMYIELGQFHRADSLLLGMFEMYERHDWPVDSMFIMNKSERAGLLGMMGRHEEAGAHLREALDHLQAQGQERSQLYGYIANSYGIHLNNIGDFAGAEPYFREALEVTRAYRGAEHPHNAQQLNNLASVIHSQDRFEEAEPYYREAIRIARATLGEEHPETGQLIHNLATLYDDLKDYARAEEAYRESIRIFEAVFGDRTHVRTAMNIRNFALSLHAAGRYREAEELHREVHTSLNTVLGPDHIYTATAAVSLGRTLTAQGRADEALEWIVPARRTFEAQLPDGHWLTAVARRDEGGARMAAGHLEQAESLLLEAYATLERVRGPSNYTTTEARTLLAELYDRTGRPELAEKFRQELVATERR